MNGVQSARGALVAVDGVEASAVLAAARRALRGRPHGGISRWDASGVFQDLAAADAAAAGPPSARTLLLLYAADLAFRLRWQIRPALAEGRPVIAAPYVDTAAAFGRAAGLPASWLTNLFRFAPRPAERQFVHPPIRRQPAAVEGFVGFGLDQIRLAGSGHARRDFVAAAIAELRRADRHKK